MLSFLGSNPGRSIIVTGQKSKNVIGAVMILDCSFG
jgi:hypothetical protein